MNVFLFGLGLGAGAMACYHAARPIAWCIVLLRKLAQPGPRETFRDSYRMMRTAKTRNGYAVPRPFAAFFAARFVVECP